VEPILHLSLPVTNLAEARDFYIDELGCTSGRQRPGWADVWFYGMQITLQDDPGHVPGEQGSRHFGVTMSVDSLSRLLDRLEAADIRWLQPRTVDNRGTPTEQHKAKLIDPSGNVVELKAYADPKVAFRD
jgi:extradiol dioxygenase family protein